MNIGDEVEFFLGRAEEWGSQCSGGSDENEKWSAFDISKLPKGTICWEKEEKPGKRWRGMVDQVAREGQEGSRGNVMRDRGVVGVVLRVLQWAALFASCMTPTRTIQ